MGQWVLKIFALYHLCVGVAAVLSLGWIRKIGGFLYATMILENVDPRFEYVLKPLGLYAIFVAMVSYYISLSGDAELQRAYYLACAFLLASRGVCRVIYRSIVYRAFQVSPIRNFTNAAFTWVCAGFFIAAYFFRW